MKRWIHALWPLVTIVSVVSFLVFSFYHWGYMTVLPIIGYTILYGLWATVGCVFILALCIWIYERYKKYTPKQKGETSKWETVNTRPTE